MNAQYFYRQSFHRNIYMYIFFLRELKTATISLSIRFHLFKISITLNVKGWTLIILFITFLIGSSCQYRYDSSAFLFSLVNKPGWAPVKLPQTGQYSYYRNSIYDCSSYGPTFGGDHDIYVASHASSSSSSYTNLGHTYSAPSGYSYGNSFSYTFLHGQSNTNNFTPDEIETFYETS